MSLRGLSDDHVSRLGLGTAQFGLDYGVTNTRGRVDKAEALRILDRAKYLGIDLLDTAAAYGSSEQVLGDLANSEFRIVTKLPPVAEGEALNSSWVVEQIRRSLLRLERSSVYGLLVHQVESLRGTNRAELARGLLEARDLGLVEKIGVSIYDPSDLTWLVETITPDLVQAPLNVFDRRLLESGWLRKLKDMGAEVHARSIFLQGTLLTRPEDLPKFLAPWRGEYEKFNEWADYMGVSLLEAALSYPLSIPGLDKIILGFSSLTELDSVFACRLNLPLRLPNFNHPDLDHIDPRRWKRH